jgi:UDP-4-amino-4,6-dideoxy-N-acetyl-beta-L-altrosamine transaminase
MIPYGRQVIDQSDIDAVADILESDWLTQGPAIERFEMVVAKYCGAAYAVAVSSATAALHLACRALGLGPGDALWTSPNTFVASANCGLYCGASVDFVDIDPRTYNMSADALANKLAEAEKSGRLPNVVVPVHFAGQSCEMEKIAALAKRYGFRIIEDASHAIGGRYLDRPVGHCRHSDITVFSFHPVKIITTGEGGMALTNKADLADKLCVLRSHGITRDSNRMHGEAEGSWYYEQIDLGYNYRMTDMQAALGTSQMRRLDDFITRRRLLAGRYEAALKDLPLVLPWQHPDAESAWHLYVVCLELEKCSKSRREVFAFLRDAGIGVNVHYIPVHLQPYYRRLGFKPGDFPEAEAYYRGAVSLPLHPGLSSENVAYIIDKLTQAIGSFKFSSQ